MFTGSSWNIFEEKQTGKGSIDSNEIIQSKLYLLLQSLELDLQLAFSFRLLKLFKSFLLSFCSFFCFSLAIRRTVFSVSWIFRWIQYTSIVYWFFRELCRFSFKDLWKWSSSSCTVWIQWSWAMVSLLMILSIGMLVYAIGAAIIAKCIECQQRLFKTN